MVSLHWTRLSDSDCKRSRPRKDNKSPRNSSGSLELVVVSKTTVLEQTSSASSTYPNQQGTHEMRDEVLSSVGAEEGMDTSGYQVSADLDDVEFYWEKDQLDVDAVFRPGIVNPFSLTAFDDLEMRGGSADNPILLNQDEDKEHSPPPRTTPVYGRPTRPPAFLRSRPFETRIENVPDYVCRNLFQ